MKWNIRILFVLTVLLLTLFDSQAQTCNGGRQLNLNPNGDFGSGITNFSSPSSLLFSPLSFSDQVPPENGFYTITNNTSDWTGFAAANWLNIGDNSSDENGYMMVINQGTAGTFYELGPSLCTDLEYTLSFDAINLMLPEVEGDTLPQLQIMINGAVVADLGTLPKNAEWQDYSFTFSPDVVPITISLVNASEGAFGNDFAIDNITLDLCTPRLVLVERDARPRCPGDNLVLDLDLGDPFGINYFYQLQVSINGGQSWLNSGGRTQEELFVINNLPPNAIYRVLAASSEENLFNTACRFESDLLTIMYADPTTCDEVIESIGELCQGSRGDNIFEDGDFGSGTSNILNSNPGLAPGYSYVTTPPPNDGSYTITNNTGPWGSFAADTWINIQDNSPDPFGYMMVVNASFSPGIFYEKTVPVCENTNYEFSADVISVNDPNFAPNFIPPNISFLINGVEVFETGDVPVDARWYTYGFTFTTRSGVNAVQLTLRNNAPGGFGNDLALDNISFRPCGPGAQIQDTTQVCIGRRVEIPADISLREAFPELAMQWQRSTTQGNTWIDVPGATDSVLVLDNPQIGEWYRLKLANRETNLGNFSCQIFSNLTVLFDDSEITELEDVLCQGQSFTIDGMDFDSSGLYQVVIPQMVGCDSVVELDLTVNPSYDLAVQRSICESEVFPFGGQNLNTSGRFQEVFQTQLGCDSIVQLDLVVEPEFDFIDTTILCFGEAYEGRIYFEDEVVTEYLSTVAGCDSLLSTYFKILPSQNQTFVREVCPGDSFNGTTVNNDTLVSVGGFNGVTCDSVTLYRLELYQDPSLEVEGPSLICSEDTATLSVSNEFASIQWSNGDTNSSIQVYEPEIIRVQAVSNNNCIYETAFKVDLVDFSADLVKEDISCFGENDGEIRILNPNGGSSPYQTTISGLGTSSNLAYTNLSPGSYFVEVREGNGCVISDSLEILEPAPFTLEMSADQSISLGDSVLLFVQPSRPATNITWSPPDFLNCSNCLEPIAVPIRTIRYQVNLQDSAGCTIEDAVNILVEKNRNLFIPNIFSPNGDRINDEFQVFPGNNVIRIEHYLIADRWGNVIKELRDVAPDDPRLNWDGNFKNQPAASGVYVWSIQVRFLDNSVRNLSGDVSLVR